MCNCEYAIVCFRILKAYFLRNIIFVLSVVFVWVFLILYFYFFHFLYKILIVWMYITSKEIWDYSIKKIIKEKTFSYTKTGFKICTGLKLLSMLFINLRQNKFKL